MTRFNNLTKGSLTLAVILLGSTAAFAQATPPATPAAPAEPMAAPAAPMAATGDALVTDTDATHHAMIEGGTALFYADEQNNTLRWTINVGADVTGAAIACPAIDGATTPTPAGEGTTEPAQNVPITAVPVEGAAAAPAEPAEVAAEGTTWTEAVNLAEDGITNGVIEGETADLEAEVYAEIIAGACHLTLTTGTDAAAATPEAPAGAMTPAEPTPAPAAPGGAMTPAPAPTPAP